MNYLNKLSKSNISERMSSDEGAIGTVETIVLLFLTVFSLIALYNGVVKPFSETSKGIGKEISNMNPQ